MSSQFWPNIKHKKLTKKQRDFAYMVALFNAIATCKGFFK